MRLVRFERYVVPHFVGFGSVRFSLNVSHSSFHPYESTAMSTSDFFWTSRLRSFGRNNFVLFLFSALSLCLIWSILSVTLMHFVDTNRRTKKKMEKKSERWSRWKEWFSHVIIAYSGHQVNNYINKISQQQQYNKETTNRKLFLLLLFSTFFQIYPPFRILI